MLKWQNRCSEAYFASLDATHFGSVAFAPYAADERGSEIEGMTTKYNRGSVIVTLSDGGA